MKTRWARSRRAFLYAASGAAASGGFSWGCAERPGVRASATPTQADQYLPDMPGMIGDAPMPMDLFGHPPARPHLGGVTGRTRAPLQQLDQLVLLVRFHLARPPRRGTGFQTGLAFAAERLHPAHHRAYETLNHAGHGLIRVPLFQKRHCFAAALPSEVRQ